MIHYNPFFTSIKLKHLLFFFYKFIAEEMDLEATLMDLSNKIPYLQHILRPEYIPYLITVTIMLIGWLLVTWIFHVIWMLLTPLAISTIIITLIFPATSEWCMQQLEANIEEIINTYVHRVRASQ